jgi:flagella basal body P-ring formation protein FlgA
MRHRLSSIMLFVAVVLTIGPATVSAVDTGPGPQESAPLQIHLPREVTVEGQVLTLGQVSVIRGDATLTGMARAIGLGRLSIPGQKVVLDRPTILSRLASSGISAGQVRLTGAEAVMVRRYQRIISADEFVEVGQVFLEQHPPAPAVCAATPTIQPKDLVLPVQVADLQLTPRFARNGARGCVTVQVVVRADGQEVGTREIPFRLQYQGHRVVTLKEIAEGEALSPENVKIEMVASDQPPPAGWQPPYGRVTVRKLAADTEIRNDMVASAQAPVVIRRNETVVIRVERPGLVVTAVGTALQEARAGEYVKVRNTDSSRIIVCKVNADGTVEPMM